MNVRFYSLHGIKITLKSHFWRENFKILPSFVQRYNGRHYVTLLNLQTTGGLSILLHGVISLSDTKLCDKFTLIMHRTYRFRVVVIKQEQ